MNEVIMNHTGRTIHLEHEGLKSTFMLGSLLIALQLLDGVFTSMGVSRFGVDIEGNPFLRVLMEQFGHVPTLAALKFIAILLVISLTIIARRLRWVRHALGAVSCIYLVAAILPWTYILFVK